MLFLVKQRNHYKHEKKESEREARVYFVHGTNLPNGKYIFMSSKFILECFFCYCQKFHPFNHFYSYRVIFIHLTPKISLAFETTLCNL